MNATIPKDMAPEAVTMEDAVKLIAQRMESGGGTKKKPAGKAKSAKPKAASANGKAAKPKPGKGAKKPKAPSQETSNESGQRGNLEPAVREGRDPMSNRLTPHADPLPTGEGTGSQPLRERSFSHWEKDRVRGYVRRVDRQF